MGVTGAESQWWSSTGTPRAWRAGSVPASVIDFHAAMPGYAPTPLIEAPAIARALEMGRVLVKDEASRLGLPAFKIFGVSWAVYRLLAALDEKPLAPTIEAMTEVAARRPGLAVTTATDGNHGRALVHIASLFGVPARIYVPAGVQPAAIAAIEGEGADVVRLNGTYDDAVSAARAYSQSTPAVQLVQDMGLAGYETIPSWIVEGYDTLSAEVDTQSGSQPLTLVVIPTGVGSLLQAALAHFCRPGLDVAPAVASVEPILTACVLASVTAGTPIVINTAGHTIMAGLNAGTVSSLA